MIQDGDLDVSGGGHGIDITGDSATVDNKAVWGNLYGGFSVRKRVS